MSEYRKTMLVWAVLAVSISAGFFLPELIRAGDIEPPPEAVDGSGNPVSTMVTLDDIYDKLDQVVFGFGIAPVEKTGQKTCYDLSGNAISCAGTGQDGEIRAGVFWPSPRFTDNGNGTVTDNLTGLVWLKQANYKDTSGGTGETDWASALAFCNALADGMCGLSDSSVAGDWRLPNVKELLSLIDYGNSLPALPAGYGSFFTNVVYNGYYWSSTTCDGGITTGWVVGISNGSVVPSGKPYDGYVWPVRGGN